mmetsp:Transcript_19849/g.79099  ORF Transcript_19849/g.79099 Transcript_19849/m.79099 type:complete len:247 (+) Transcript_19849:1519-2259(+)
MMSPLSVQSSYDGDRTSSGGEPSLRGQPMPMMKMAPHSRTALVSRSWIEALGHLAWSSSGSVKRIVSGSEGAMPYLVWTMCSASLMMRQILSTVARRYVSVRIAASMRTSQSHCDAMFECVTSPLYPLRIEVDSQKSPRPTSKPKCVSMTRFQFASDCTTSQSRPYSSASVSVLVTPRSRGMFVTWNPTARIASEPSRSSLMREVASKARGAGHLTTPRSAWSRASTSVEIDHIASSVFCLSSVGL